MTNPVAFTAAGTGGSPASGGGARPKLEHAYLELRTPPPGAGLTPGPPCGRIDFQFNPKEVSLAKSAEEISGETPGQNPTSGTLHARRVHRVRAGDTLPHLAWREYGDPAAWRVIAEANGIDDPMRLAHGQELLLPALDELGR